MAFPTLPSGGTNPSLAQQTATATTWTAVNLPSATGGILANDLILVVAGINGNGTNGITNTAGLTFTTLQDAAGDGNAVRYFATYARCAGGETGTFSITTTVANGGGAAAYLIRGAHTTQAPAIGTGVNASTANANPPSLTPGWGAEDTLWFATAVIDANVAFTAAPTNYTNLQNPRWANANGAGAGIAQRELNAASEDPGAFTNTAENTRANTIAIRPAPAAAAEEVPYLAMVPYRGAY